VLGGLAHGPPAAQAQLVADLGAVYHIGAVADADRLVFDAMGRTAPDSIVSWPASAPAGPSPSTPLRSTASRCSRTT
jgi:hypothetical protein